MPPCLTLSIIRYGSRVKWRIPGKGVASSPTPWCSSYRKMCLRVTLDYGRQLYLLTSFNLLVTFRSVDINNKDFFRMSCVDFTISLYCKAKKIFFFFIIIFLDIASFYTPTLVDGLPLQFMQQQQASPRFFSVFWPISTILLSGWTLRVIWFLNLSVPLQILWGLFWVFQ